MSAPFLQENTIYNNSTGESIKFAPKAAYSGEYRARKNLRVVGYARVSTDKYEQEISFETQLAHYKDFIAKQPGWIYCGTYSDDGESATSIRRRYGFRKMIKDAEQGLFDMIICKDISRFSRNTLDGLRIADRLRNLKPPVGVFFEIENFNTLDKNTELVFTILLSFAQGESLKRSEAIKKALHWRCDNEIYFTPTNNLLGYTKENGSGKPIYIEQEGADTVKAIFAMYLHGLPASQIAMALTISGKVTAKNNKIWSPSGVLNILRNEKYCGDVVQIKTTVGDVLEHKSDRNVGQEVLFYKNNHHAPIVSREECVRAFLLERCNSSSACYNPRYEIEIIKKGLLAGFIPINFAFGGYDAEHYIGAELISKITAIKYAVEIPRLSGYEIIRAQDANHKLSAQMTLSIKHACFNSDCVSQLPDAKFVEVLLHPTERLVAVRPSSKSNPNAVSWNVKPISSAYFCPVLFKLMGWNSYQRYKIIAECFVRGNDRVIMFNLPNSEYQLSEIDADAETKRRITRLLQPEKWRNEFGADFESQMTESRRAYSLCLDDWQINAKAERVPGFEGNPAKRTDEELKSHLKSLGVYYV